MKRSMRRAPQPPTLVISCHADTPFREHWLRRSGDRCVGHLDNFAGVYAVMTAFFSGRLVHHGVRIELTSGEETGMQGARAVAATLSPDDFVAVVDVTGVETDALVTIGKCASPRLQQFVRAALAGCRYTLFEDCPDPVADLDESDVYREVTDNVVFLGIPCQGGDYNAGPVECRLASIEAASEAIIRLADHFVRTFHRGAG